MSAFSGEEYRKSIAALKYNKAVDIDYIHVVANNDQQIPHREYDPKTFETIEDYRHIETRERLQRATDLYPSYATHTSYMNE